MNPLSLIGGGLGILGSLGGLITGFGNAGKLNNMANAINPVNPTYAVSQYAKDRLSLAQNLLNAQMPGSAALERNIASNQATADYNIGKSATDSSQALAAEAAAGGQANQAYANLAVQNQQDYYNRLGNLSNAQQGMVAEGDKVYQDKLRNYQEQMALKNAYLGAAMQNKANTWSSLANTGIAAFGLGQQMGMGGGGGAAAPSPYLYTPDMAGIGGYSNPDNLAYMNPNIGPLIH